ncbi:hypothetical protein GCM10027562_04240 [Arthrobacter pigmenti]
MQFKPQFGQPPDAAVTGQRADVHQAGLLGPADNAGPPHLPDDQPGGQSEGNGRDQNGNSSDQEELQ